MPLSPEEFQKQCLAEHNRYRAEHGCPSLKINAQLTKQATDWAQNLSRRNTAEHRQPNDYGENIYVAGGLEVTPQHPVKMWYDEIAKYNFEAAAFSPEVGHFTQLIWRDTKEVGIGIAKKEEKTWVVANYNPPGNFIGAFKENVPKRLHNAPNTSHAQQEPEQNVVHVTDRQTALRLMQEPPVVQRQIVQRQVQNPPGPAQHVQVVQGPQVVQRQVVQRQVQNPPGQGQNVQNVQRQIQKPK